MHHMCAMHGVWLWCWLLWLHYCGGMCAVLHMMNDYMMILWWFIVWMTKCAVMVMVVAHILQGVSAVLRHTTQPSQHYRSVLYVIAVCPHTTHGTLCKQQCVYVGHLQICACLITHTGGRPVHRWWPLFYHKLHSQWKYSCEYGLCKCVQPH